MKLFENLKQYWRQQTGEDETPLDGDSPAFFASFFVHLAILILMGLLVLPEHKNQVTLTISQVTEEKVKEELELQVPEEFFFSEQPSEEVGANSVGGVAVALSLAPVVSDVSEVPNHQELLEEAEVGNVEVNDAIAVATGLNYSQNQVVKGAAGVGETGAEGAIDRITHEILLSLEERKTLVVWLFDSTASLVPQRAAIRERFDRIYKELGIIEAAGNENFTKHSDQPLLSSIIAFGQKVEAVTKEPTANLSELKEAIASIKNDDSGTENVFYAVHEAAKKYAPFRYTTEEKPRPERNVMIVVVTDEVGSDWKQGLEPTVRMCRRWAMPVYVVGVPAPFGRQDTMMKWVDPDPKYDQTPQWGVVEQGPETLYPERIKLAFSGSKLDDDPIDSGFGPYGLTRLSVETGGIYFAVHPNRSVTKTVSRKDTMAYTSHLKHFFDPTVMRRYKPDYVSVQEYDKRVSANMARRKLIEAALNPQLQQMESPETRFVNRDEASFSNALSEAQKQAAALEPRVNGLYEILRQGESDREKETVLRWQAGYDLAMGRVLAVKVRTESYNAMLAAAKRGLKPKDPKSNTWTLKPDDEISVGSALQKVADRAKMYLERVVKDHEGTPWAMLAQQELKDPLGWKWEESFTDVTPMREGAGNGNAPAPANDAAKMLAKPPPKRPAPKL
ncbi:vWA domain-containing protein [Anatilimnocola sp. NA78]|uniref:vWA domain-containing protein n=1 Tax=Anatilimnocola sp. NA78 TaxID=3415683 RepID=UPI003CE53F37